jgi:PKD repeat protein
MAFEFDFTIDGLAVRFFNRTVFGANAWHWDFGDLSSSTIREPRHTYAAAGNYFVTLTATCNGKTSSITKTLKLVAPGAGAQYLLDTTNFLVAADLPIPGVNQQYSYNGQNPIYAVNLYALNDSMAVEFIEDLWPIFSGYTPGDVLDITGFITGMTSFAGVQRTFWLTAWCSTSGGDYEMMMGLVPTYTQGSGSTTTVDPSFLGTAVKLITTAPPSEVDLTDSVAIVVNDYTTARVTFGFSSRYPAL